ncbi:MAG: ion transporter [Halobacteriovoraceae bacterium]|nr:ion transporter [Halobacteriovoraceae bacterium]|tara:strand:+ start:7973 stop:8785 length:813 start_codon:yes stop_codon:yes gene_type:complete
MSHLKQELRRIIFGTDTKAGKTFDLILIVTVILSIIIVMLESVEELRDQFQFQFFVMEWLFTLLFTFEIALRIYCAEKKSKYIFSFYGVVDFLSILPAYLTALFPGLHTLGVIRALRILRIFRILKLNRYVLAADELLRALSASKAKITIFLGTVITLVIVIGALMYLVEGPENGFTSIPKGIYWAIVTMTTVGFGDVVPQTPLGQFISSSLMIIGYGIIAVPTGLVTVDLVSQRMNEYYTTIECIKCHKTNHEKTAHFCSTCGEKLQNK